MGLILGVATFAFDVGFSLGVASWVGYLSAILIGMWLPYKWYPVLTAAGSSILLLYSFLFDPLEVSFWVIILNVSLAIFSFWLMALLVMIRKKESVALSESQRTLSNLMDNLPGMAYRCYDDSNRTMEFVSDGCLKLTGYHSAELVKSNVLFYSQLIHPDDRGMVQCQIDESKKERIPYRMVYRLSSKSGELKWVWEQGISVFNEQGKFLFYEGFLLDITNRKKLEEELMDSNLQLQEAITDLREAHQNLLKQERLKALGEMSSGIAHDFNNVLTSIIGFSELLMDEAQFTEQSSNIKQYLESIQTSANDAGKIVDRLREFYKPRGDGMQFKQVELNELIEQIIYLTEPKWKKIPISGGTEIKVEKDLKERLPILGSESDLREVMTNLIFNAVDAMPQGGKIHFRSYQDKDRAVLEISDTGIGMDSETKKNCLNPFFTTKGEKGTGLGLSIISVIIERHQGEIKIESEKGKGTTFKITFPLLDEFETKSRLTEDKEFIVAPERILILEDDRSVLGAITSNLIRDGHMVLGVSDIRTALSQIKMNHYDLLFADGSISLKENGKFISQVRQIDPKLNIVLITGFRNISLGPLTKGVHSVLYKPVTKEMLRKVMAQIRSSSSRKAA